MSIKKEEGKIKRKEVLKILNQEGWAETRRGKGSHEVFINPKTGQVTTIPQAQGNDLPKGTLAAIRRQTGIEKIK